MKKFKKNSITIAFAVSLAFGFGGPAIAFAAATAPTLGAMESFSVLAKDSAAANGAGATLSGDLGLSTGSAVSRTGVWAVGGIESFADINPTPAFNAQAAATAAKINMAAQPSDGAWGPASLAPGVWTSAGSPVFAGTLTLTGNATDVWVFQLTTDFTFTGTINLAGGAQACNVFWQIGQDATINSGGAGSKFVGTLIAGRDVSLVGGVTVDGRIISNRDFTAAGGDTITVPTCAVAAPVSSRRYGTINVVKLVINDGGGTKTVADFPLFVNGMPVVSGETNTFQAPAPRFQVSETSDANYVQSFSGDCGLLGGLNLNPGDNKFCIITNNDISAPVVALPPPLIDLVRIATPSALPSGPGQVTFTNTLRNIGIVPVSNVTLVGDTCSPVVFVSGDTNNDAKLDVNETWIYHCTMNVPATHTSSVTATGWANGVSTVDIANNTVIVGVPVVAPLIHVTKIPSSLALRAGGGMVTYTKTVTNPGTVALNNVRLTDDMCNPVKFVYGDTNNDAKLDVTETWIYSCSMNLAKTTTNMVIAEGDANGITARDVAIATVVVATPKLPNTGYAPTSDNLTSGVALIGVFAASLFALYVARKKHVA